MISCAVIIVRHADLNAATSSSPSSLTNFIRLIDERLHAESSRNMYSEHGLLALMRSVFGHVCQSLTVVSNCIPGSPHTHVPAAICRIMSQIAAHPRAGGDLPHHVARLVGVHRRAVAHGLRLPLAIVQ